VSFDLVVWAMDSDASADDVGAAFELCQQGEHEAGEPHPRITGFYTGITAAYPDHGGPAAVVPHSPWEVTPLHVATDHVEMKLSDVCADDVLLAVERLAAENGLLLFDPQGGTVYPPASTVG